MLNLYFSQNGTYNNDVLLLLAHEIVSAVQPGGWILLTPVAPLGVAGNGQQMICPSGFGFLIEPSR